MTLLMLKRIEMEIRNSENPYFSVYKKCYIFYFFYGTSEFLVSSKVCLSTKRRVSDSIIFLTMKVRFVNNKFHILMKLVII